MPDVFTVFLNKDDDNREHNTLHLSHLQFVNNLNEQRLNAYIYNSQTVYCKLLKTCLINGLNCLTYSIPNNTI